MAKSAGREKHRTYYDHLEVFRINVLVIGGFLVISSVLSFVFIEKIMVFLQEPISGINTQLNYFRPQEKFITYIKTAFFSGLFFTVPFSVFVMGAFIYPGLKKEERKIFYTFTFLVPAVFLGGGFFAYKVITPVAFNFLVNFASGDNVKAVWGISSYFSFLITIIFVMGLVFLMPLALYGMMRAEIVTSRSLAKARPFIAVIILVLAAFFTPPDVITQVMVGLPLYLLFELAVLAGKISGK